MPAAKLIDVIFPELLLVAVACVLMILGATNKTGLRRAVPFVALAALAYLFFAFLLPDLAPFATGGLGTVKADATNAVRVHEFGFYVKMITAGIGVLLVLLAWPSDHLGTGNRAVYYGHDAGEFFGLMLLALAGVYLVASANDMVLLFLGLELASLPAYVMVSISRPVPAAQEAGVKYFFLGAMAAAVMLFGFSYLYGATGTTDLYAIAKHFRASYGASMEGPSRLSAMEMLAAVMLIGGLAFKLAAVPFHFYAGDVYQGAATPVTAFLSFVPKTSGMVALVKLMFVFGGGTLFAAPKQIADLIWVLAVLSMTVGNFLGVVQAQNVKRVLAYSSVAHSGYMLAAVAVMLKNPSRVDQALLGLMFYLAAYGLMNVGAFGVLVLLPSKSNLPATSAETFDDLAGTGRRHAGLGGAMAICCLSLIGLPMTVGFFGKFMILRPALESGMYWLVIITVVNAAVSAAYYLRIVAAMFLRGETAGHFVAHPPPAPPSATEIIYGDPSHPGFVPKLALPTVIAVVLSAAGTVLFGTVLPATTVLSTRAQQGSVVDEPVNPNPASFDEPAANVVPAAPPVPSGR